MTSSAKTPKKILLAFSGGFKGGAENVMIDVLSILNEDSRFNLEVALSGEGEVRKLLSGKEFSEINLSNFEINSFLSLKSPLPFLKEVFKLVKLIRNREIDLCLVEGKVLTQVFAVAGLLTNKKIISHVHFPPSDWELKRVLYQHCFKILTCCSSLHKYFLEAGFHKSKLSYLRNFVDSEKFRPSVNKTPNEEFIKILLTGHLSKVKGQREAIEVVSELLKEGQKVKLFLAGRDNSEEQKYFTELKALVKKLCLEENIIFLSNVENILAEYQKADIFLLPSLQEGLPLVVLEAMSCSLPVVATEVDGTPEAVLDGETGFLVKLDGEVVDKKELKKKLKTLIEDSEKRIEMGVLGRKRAQQEFSKKVFEKELVEFIEASS